MVERDNIVLYGAGYTVQGIGSGTGIDLTGRSNVTITNMKIKAFDHGIHLLDSSNNSISGNNIANNKYGVYLTDFSNNNTISGNTITNNDVGVYIREASNNKFYNNNFINNTKQVYDLAWKSPHVVLSTNVWDDGYPSGGNYWSDHTDVDQYSGPNQNETGSDEIWDTPYVIDENNQDNYPIVPEFPSFIILPLFMTATLIAVLVYRRKHSV